MLLPARAELLKLTSGRAMIGALAGGVFMCAITGYGYYSEGVADPGAMASGSVTGDVIRAWMMMLLFSAIAGALVVTRDFAHGTISRSVLAYGGRDEVFLAKILSTFLISLVFAAVAMIGAAVTVFATMDDPVWTADCTATLIGVGTCVVLAGFWGLGIGWLVRNQTLAVLAVVILIVGLEPAIQRLAPEVSQFLFSIALSSVYRDPKPHLLPVGLALLVSLVWIAALGAAGRVRLARRDVG